jgi:hypothetical protein
VGSGLGSGLGSGVPPPPPPSIISFAYPKDVNSKIKEVSKHTGNIPCMLLEGGIVSDLLKNEKI